MTTPPRLQNFWHVMSLGLGASVSILIFIIFLQTPVVSKSRLLITAVIFVVTTLVNFFVGIKWLVPKLEGIRFGINALFAYSFLLPLVFLPMYFVTPEYPVSPLLQPKTDIALQFTLAPRAKPVTISEADLKIVMGREEVLGLRNFELNGSGRKPDAALLLEPGKSTWLQMEVSATSTVILNVKPREMIGTLTVFWDRNISVAQLPVDLVLKRKFETPFMVLAFYFLAQYILIAYILLLFGVWVGTKQTQRSGVQSDLSYWVLVPAVILFSAITVYFHIFHMFGDSVFTIQNDQYMRHVAVLQGTAPNPWQYRVFSEWVAALLIWLFDFVLARDRAIIYGFVLLRLFQNILIFFLAYRLYRKISLSGWQALLGISILVGSMLNANYDSDLALNTYFDIIFYLLVSLFILDKKYYWIVPLTILAALNRETSGLIPFLLLVALLNDQQIMPWKKYLLVGLSLSVWLVIFLGLRWIYPDSPAFVVYGHVPGVSMWLYNVTRSLTWEQLFRTFGLLPLVSLFYFFEWPRLLQWFFIVMIPIWFGIHFITSVAAETRLFLVPITIVFIPGFLASFGSILNKSNSPEFG